MSHVLKNFSIVDITYHAEVDSLTGKVKFQFEDAAEPAGMDHYVTVDVAIAADDNDSLHDLRQQLVAQAISVLHAAIDEASIDGMGKTLSPAPNRRSH